MGTWTAKCSYGKGMKGHQWSGTVRAGSYEELVRKVKKLRDFARGKHCVFKYSKAKSPDGTEKQLDL
jgi:hypothetical protein